MSDVTSSNENNPLEISFKADLKEATDSEPDLLRRVPSKAEEQNLHCKTAGRPCVYLLYSWEPDQVGLYRIKNFYIRY